MISVKNVTSAKGASHYFAADNYYTQDESLEKSEWFGEAASTLGFSGQINGQDFLTTLDGKVESQELGKFILNPETGEAERDHRPGTDITFSAPKSVSLLAEVAGNRDVREAHEKAVKAALSYIESDLTQTRQMIKGEVKSIKTGNIAVAMFRHNTSRDLDPQTHTHAVIMNATQCKDGRWRSLSHDDVFKAQRTIGAIYSGELAMNLQKLGFALTRTDDKGNFEIAGISREQIEHFSKRRAEIITSLKERGIDINDASPRLKENATLMTRAKKVDVDHDVLIADWKERAREVGINFDALQAVAAKVREQGGVSRSDALSGRAAMEFAAAHLIEREAVVSQQDLLSTALWHSVGRASPLGVIGAFDKLEQEGHLIKLSDKENTYTSAKMSASEKWSVEQVAAQKGVVPKILSPDVIAAQLKRMEGQRSFKFTDGQKEAITKVLSTEDRFIAVQGLAGTGKSTMLKTLRELAQNEGYLVRGMAPTGVASKVMARETGVATDTVSMFLIKERQLGKDVEFTKEHVPDFTRKQELWIVDESSFLSQRQKFQLDNMALKANARVAYLGDALQLQGVEAGKPFELTQRAGIETAYMTEINRQKTSILKNTVDRIIGRDQLQEGEKLTAVELKHNERAFRYMDEAGLVKEHKNGLINTVVSELAAMSKVERERTLVITAFNKDRHAINLGLREKLKEMGEISSNEQKKEIYVSQGWTRAIIKEAQYYSDGDIVRFGRAYQQINADKGDYMRVVSSVDAPYGTVRLKKQDGTVIHWEPKKNNKVEVYKIEERQIGQGDLIRMTRNDEQFKNGEIGRVIAIKGDQVTLEVNQGTTINQHDISLSTCKHWDYAYASTVHSAQGATQYRTLFHIQTKEIVGEQKDGNSQKWMAKIFGNRSFYVGTTRATHEMTIYTNNKEEALKVVTQKQDKTSSLEVMNKKMVSKEAPDEGTVSERQNIQKDIHQVHDANYLR